MKKVSLMLVIMLCCHAASWAQVWIEVAFKDLQFELPTFLTWVPDGSGRLVVTEKTGNIYAFANDPAVRQDQRVKILDARETVGRLKLANEEGLLGFAFDPNFANNRFVYLHHTAHKPRRGQIVRYKMQSESLAIDPQSREVLLEVRQPWGNHNGGMIAFGSDGYLYIAFGDGGSAGDPKNSGQDLSTLLGAILRIDVSRQAKNKRYAIPEDNPFVGQAGARDEIYAYGLRNVWRFSFDRKTKQLWAADVGQNAFEEIDLITKGGNYGWRAREGFKPFKKGKKRKDMIDPVWAYPRKEGMSVTGGYVYRGKNISSLQGAYVFGDYVSSKVWALWQNEETGKLIQHKLIGDGKNPASFGEDENGEIYICSYHQGKILKLAGN